METENWLDMSEIYTYRAILCMRDFLGEINKPIIRRKCDFDVEISRDIYNNLANFETLLIFTMLYSVY